MLKLIPIINKLQDVFHTLSLSNIDLPQIIVIGSQSSGKSSVLESIIGNDFLPRGIGIITRRPLILQLIPNKNNLDIDNNKDYGEFLHIKNKRFYDFNDIKNEIILETSRLLGNNKGVSSEPIRLKIYSSNVLPLTLVDLPGMTKIPVGDQPLDIENQIRDMILSYISNPSSIILAISAANQDIANSESLKLAALVDPNGLRTVGVLTKLDLMDKGTDAMDVLLGKTYPLKLGFMGIVNRCQQDIVNNVTVNEARQYETNFFSSSPTYRCIAHRLGIDYLTRSLNVILMNHIKDCLPNLRHKISGHITDKMEELESFGEEEEPTNKGAVLLSLIGKYVSNFKDALDGKLQDVYGGQLTELYGGSRISYTFHELFARAVDSIDPFSVLSDDDIRTAIRNATGPRPSLFVPEIAFDLLVKKQIVRLEEPSIQCCELIFDELLSIANQCDAPEFERYEFLRDKIVEQVHVLTRKRLGPTEKMLKNLIQIELAYINTSHPDFIGGTNAISLLRAKEEEKLTDKWQLEPEVEKKKSSFFSMLSHEEMQIDTRDKDLHTVKEMMEQSLEDMEDYNFKLPSQIPPLKTRLIATDREKVETGIIKSLILSYFNIVRKTIQDAVPKTIMCFLVNSTTNNLQSELVSALYKEGDYNLLLQESGEISHKRTLAQNTLMTLHRALEITNEIRDFVLPAHNAK